MLSDIFKNRFVVTAYILGVITIALAIYLLLTPYSSISNYYNGTAINATFTINPSDVVFVILKTSNESLNVNITVTKWIPDTNITVTLYYEEYLSPYQTRSLNFTTITSLSTSSMGQGIITIIGIRRTKLIDALTIILTILFILVIGLLIIGFADSIINIKQGSEKT